MVALIQKPTLDEVKLRLFKATSDKKEAVEYSNYMVSSSDKTGIYQSKIIINKIIHEILLMRQYHNPLGL